MTITDVDLKFPSTEGTAWWAGYTSVPGRSQYGQSIYKNDDVGAGMSYALGLCLCLSCVARAQESHVPLHCLSRST